MVLQCWYSHLHLSNGLQVNTVNSASSLWHAVISSSFRVQKWSHLHANSRSFTSYNLKCYCLWCWYKMSIWCSPWMWEWILVWNCFLLVTQAEYYHVKLHLFVCPKRFRIEHHLYPCKHFVIYSILIIVELECFSAPVA